MNLRPYQLDARNSIARALLGATSTLCVMPTGTGKTVVFSEIASIARHGHVLVLVHREELAQQAHDTLHRYGVDVGIEMADRTVLQGRWWSIPKVTVASVQTLNASEQRRLKELLKQGKWSTCIVDEAHHAPAPSYRAIFETLRAANPEIRIIGVTATPDRADELAMGSVFETVAFRYEMLDAIRDGWLVEPVMFPVHIAGLTYENCRTTAGDLNGADLAAVMEEDRVIHEVAKPTLELTAGGKRALIFSPRIQHAERLCAILNGYDPGTARFVHGGTPKDERRDTIAAFKAGEFNRLCNVGVFTEGFDAPETEFCVLARPTKSRSLYAQMVGRITRPVCPELNDLSTPEERRAAIARSTKPRGVVLDFVGNTGRHKLVTMADILGGKWPDEIRDRAGEILREGDGTITTEDALAQAEAEAEAKRKAEAEKKANELRRRGKVRAKVRYTLGKSNPFDLLDIAPPQDVALTPATQSQIEYLAKHGIKADGFDESHAERLVRGIKRRFAQGKATPKQVQLLRRFKIDATDMSFKQASRELDALAANGWKKVGA